MAAAHVGCCVFCDLCVVFACVIIILFFLANQLVEIDLDKEQISKLCATVNKKPPQTHTECGMIHTGCTEPHIDARVVLGVCTNGAKSVLQRVRFS